MQASRQDKNTETVTQSSLHLLYENGAYARELLFGVAYTAPALHQDQAVLMEPSQTETHPQTGAYVGRPGRRFTGWKKVPRAQWSPSWCARWRWRGSRQMAVLSDGTLLCSFADGSLAIWPCAGRSTSPHPNESGGQPSSGRAVARPIAQGRRYGQHLKFSLQDQSVTLYCDGDDVAETQNGLRFADLRQVQVTGEGRIAGYAGSAEQPSLCMGNRSYMALMTPWKSAGRVWAGWALRRWCWECC